MTEEEKYESLCERADDITEKYLYYLEFDPDAFYRMCYETYQYFKARENHALIYSAEIGLLCKIAAVSGFRDYPDNCKRFEFDAAMHLAYNLLKEIEECFPGHYEDYSMVITRNWHVPAGCDDYPLDMRSYESFYDDLIDFFFDDEQFYEDSDVEEEKYEKMYEKFVNR